MYKIVDGIRIDLTQEEIDQLKIEQRKFEVSEKHRPLSQEEVSTLFIKAQVNTLEIDDQTSLRMLDYYPTFNEVIGQSVSQGFKFTHHGKLYKVIQPTLTIRENYAPGTGTESLYARIDEEHGGDLYDPVPYDGNMALENGKYYTQDDVIYLCIIDTGNPVYNTLAELVGLYVETV